MIYNLLLLLLFFTCHQPAQCDHITRWWISNLSQWLIWAYDLSIIATNLLFTSPMSAPTAVRLTSDGESASYLVCQHRPSRLLSGSYSHLDVPHFRPSIPIPRCLSTESSAHLSVAYLLCRFPVSCHPLPFYTPCLSPLPPRLPDSCRLCSRASYEITFRGYISFKTTCDFVMIIHLLYITRHHILE